MPSAYSLEFEKPLLELERQIEDLKRIGTERQIDIEGELGRARRQENHLDERRVDAYRTTAEPARTPRPSRFVTPAAN